MRKPILAAILLCATVIILRWSTDSATAERSAGSVGAVASENGDVNGDGNLDVSDAIYLLLHLFSGGPDPVACAADDNAAALRSDLANVEQASLGDGLIGAHRTLPTASAFRLHDYHENRPINVKTDFGAVGDGVADDTAALRRALDAVPHGGGVVVLPPGVYRITETLLVNNRRSFHLRGSGFGHAGERTGTIIKWSGGTGQTMLHLDGFSQSSVERLALDGSGVEGVIGIHLENSDHFDNELCGEIDPEHEGFATQMNLFEQVTFVNLHTGIKIGETGEKQANNDNIDLDLCWFRDNQVGVHFQCDQAFQWRFRSCQFLKNKEAGIRTGSSCPNSGGFQVFGGSFLDNGIDFDIPRVTSPILIEAITSEGARMLLSHESATGDAARSITLQGVWQNSSATDAESSIRFTTANNLLVMGCGLDRPVEVGRDSGHAGGTSYRTFMNTRITVRDGGERIRRLTSQFEQDVVEIGNPDG